MPTAELTSDAGHIAVATDWNQRDLIKLIPGARYKRGNEWHLPLTWAACVQLRGVFGDSLTIGPNLMLWAKQCRSDYVDPATEMRDRTEGTILTEHPSGIADEIARLYPFQRSCVDFMRVTSNAQFTSEWGVGGGLLGDEMGCLTGDSIIHVNRRGKGYKLRLDELVARFNGTTVSGPRCNYADGQTKVRGLSADGTMRSLPLIGVKDTGVRSVIQVNTEDGKQVKCTPGHEILTPNGKVRADSLRPGDAVLTDPLTSVVPAAKQRVSQARVLPDGRQTDKDGYVRVHGTGHPRSGTGGVYEHILVAEDAYGMSIDESFHVHHINGIKHDNRPENLELLDAVEHLTHHGIKHRVNLGDSYPCITRVVSINDVGTEHVYDLSIADDAHTYVANGIVVGNTGKTIEVLGYLLHLQLEQFPVLIVCPNSLKLHWSKRISEWIPYASPFVIEGNAKQRQAVLDEAAETPAAIVIVNYESLRTLSRLAPYGATRLRRCRECDPDGGDEIVKPAQCQAHPKPLNGFGFGAAILDEAHRIKEPSSQQTRAVWALCHESSVKHVWALTGTPIANHVGDLWSVMHAVNRHEYPTRSTFTERYGLQVWKGWGGVDIGGLNPANEAEFRRFFDPRFRRMTKTRVLPQLPPKVHTSRIVEMGQTQRRMYRELEATLMCRTDDGELIITGHQIVAQTRLAQLACATCKIEYGPDSDPSDPKSWKVELREPSSKIDELMLVVEELGGRQAVVAAEHAKLIELASQRLTQAKVPHLCITGDVAPIDRQRALDALEAGTIQLLLFTAKAGGVGLDMSAASCLIWLQHPWSMVEYLQAEDRVRRIGSERHNQIDIVHIVTKDTIEEDKLTRLSSKLERLEQITRDRQRLIESGATQDQLDAEMNYLATAFLGKE